MNAVVDTNVVAYYLLGTEPFAREAGWFWRSVRRATAPAVWEAELANVIWMAVRTGVVSSAVGHRRLRLASRLGIRTVPNRLVWQGALARAVGSDVPVYDTLFVELAVREKIPMVTFDAKVLNAFPEVAMRPGTLGAA